MQLSQKLWELAKMLNYDFYRGRYSSWNGTTANVVERALDHVGNHVFTMEWRICQCCISWAWPTFSRSWNLKCEYLENDESWRIVLNYDNYWRWYLQYNGTIVLDLNFQSHNFETLSRKRRELLQKRVIWLWPSLIYIRYGMAPLWILYFDLYFEGQTLSCYEFGIRNCTESGYSRQVI